MKPDENVTEIANNASVTAVAVISIVRFDLKRVDAWIVGSTLTRMGASQDVNMPEMAADFQFVYRACISCSQHYEAWADPLHKALEIPRALPGLANNTAAGEAPASPGQPAPC